MYHAQCLQKTGEYLKSRNLMEEYQWLEQRCHAVPLVDQTGPISGAQRMAGSAVLLSSLLTMMISGVLCG